MKTISLQCKGKHETYPSRPAADADAQLWATRIVRGEDGLVHAFELECDYREFKKISPTNYR